ncbi:hypothetical protein QJS66_06025 [Kocuria rhizophila]|nr:hypothetical protein QJS66_06025 [Kocuria rhizophila]
MALDVGGPRRPARRGSRADPARGQGGRAPAGTVARTPCGPRWTGSSYARRAGAPRAGNSRRVPQRPGLTDLTADRLEHRGRGRRAPSTWRTGSRPHAAGAPLPPSLLEGGADLRVVQELLGLASLATTQIYTRVSVESLREVYATSHHRRRSAGPAQSAGPHAPPPPAVHPCRHGTGLPLGGMNRSRACPPPLLAGSRSPRPCWAERSACRRDGHRGRVRRPAAGPGLARRAHVRVVRLRDGVLRRQVRRGAIYWSPDTGARAQRGAIYAGGRPGIRARAQLPGEPGKPVRRDVRGALPAREHHIN